MLIDLCLFFYNYDVQCVLLQEERRLSKDLQDRVSDYFAYMFMQKKWRDNDDFLQLLPITLQVDYSYVANRYVFRQV